MSPAYPFASSDNLRVPQTYMFARVELGAFVAARADARAQLGVAAVRTHGGRAEDRRLTTFLSELRPPHWTGMVQAEAEVACAREVLFAAQSCDWAIGDMLRALLWLAAGTPDQSASETAASWEWCRRRVETSRLLFERYTPGWKAAGPVTQDPESYGLAAAGLALVAARSPRDLRPLNAVLKLNDIVSGQVPRLTTPLGVAAAQLAMRVEGALVAEWIGASGGHA